MLVLVETAAGYALFKVKNEGLLKMSAAEVAGEFASDEKARRNVNLKNFFPFADSKAALAEAVSLTDAEIGKGLKRFLKKEVLEAKTVDRLAICDKALGITLKKKLGIDVVFSPETHELIRGIRSQFLQLVPQISPSDSKKMALSLSHTLSRFKLKFSPEKLDTMIIQAIGLLDDLDRELNNFAMRLKEWYGWHFPELPKIVTDNLLFARSVKKIGFRHQAQNSNLSEILPDEITQEVKQAAEISMGTEITDDDLANIIELAERVEELMNYRASLSDYLRYRMAAIAPNLTYLVGELVGARLISHSGSLMQLAKHPASTVQILGAEKALFRALKTKTQTPKYGLIYHAALVGQSAPKFKGKISRVLAAKLSLSIRVDALGDQVEPTVAIASRRYVEKKLEELTGETASSLSRKGAKPNMQKYEPSRGGAAATYSASADTPTILQTSTTVGEKDEISDGLEAEVKRKKRSSDETLDKEKKRHKGDETLQIPKKQKKCQSETDNSADVGAKKKKKMYESPAPATEIAEEKGLTELSNDERKENRKQREDSDDTVKKEKKKKIKDGDGKNKKADLESVKGKHKAVDEGKKKRGTN